VSSFHDIDIFDPPFFGYRSQAQSRLFYASIVGGGAERKGSSVSLERIDLPHFLYFLVQPIILFFPCRTISLEARRPVNTSLIEPCQNHNRKTVSLNRKKKKNFLLQNSFLLLQFFGNGR